MNQRKMSILVVEDDPDISEVLELNLSSAGYSVEVLADGAAGLAAAKRGTYDLLILDVMLPGQNGFTVCKSLRGEKNNIPILMLTCRDDELDRVRGLELGADDYLGKPFSLQELLARVKALLRRAHPTPKSERGLIVVSDLTIDPERKLVSRGERGIELTKLEFDLLHFLVSNADVPFSREALLDRIWGYETSGYEHTVTSHINRLRQKLEDNPSQPRFIKTRRGMGYYFSRG